MCVAENIVGRSESDFYLNIQYPVMMRRVSPAGEVSVSSGDSLSLECLVAGNPTPQIHWQRGEETVVQGPVLTIDSVELRHSGQYHCSASNTVPGSRVNTVTSEPVSVEVRSAPVIVSSSDTEVRVVQGEDVVITAEFCSNPESHVVWSRSGNGNMLSETRDTGIFSIVEPEKYFTTQLSNNVLCHRTELILTNVKSSESGIYKIKLENELGSVEEEFNLVVEENHFLHHSDNLLLAVSGGFLLTIIILLIIILSLCWRQHHHQRPASSAELESDLASSRETESETYSRDNSAEELIFSSSTPEIIKHHLHTSHEDSFLGVDCEGGGESENSENFANTIYNFPRSANSGSLRKGRVLRKVYNDSAYIHINTNAYSYVSFDDVDKQISNIL